MFEFREMRIQGTEGTSGALVFRVYDNQRDFFNGVSSLGYSPPPGGPKELRGMTFCAGGPRSVKVALIALCRPELDIELVAHEVRHALFWILSDKDNVLQVDMADAERDEMIGQTLDNIVNSAVLRLEEHFGVTLVWRVHG